MTYSNDMSMESWYEGDQEEFPNYIQLPRVVSFPLRWIRNIFSPPDEQASIADCVPLLSSADRITEWPDAMVVKFDRNSINL